MKGVLSSADYQAAAAVRKALSPDAVAGYEAGGHPDEIPTLTYEQMQEYYNTYYHPSNSYFLLSGSLPYGELLERINEELSRFDRRVTDASYPKAKPWQARRTFRDSYSLDADKAPAGRDYLCCGAAVDRAVDADFYVALPVLAEVLCNRPGTPVRKALEEAGLVTSLSLQVNASAQEPELLLLGSGGNRENAALFEQTVEEALRQAAEKGLDHEMISRMIREEIYRFTRRDYGWVTRGIMCAVDALDSWMFDPEQPFLYLSKNQTRRHLLQLTESGYFEQLIRDCFLDNPHVVYGVVEADPGKEERRVQQQRLLLEEKRRQLTPAEWEQIREQEAELKAWILQPGSGSPLPRVRYADLERSYSNTTLSETKQGRFRLLCHSTTEEQLCQIGLLFPLPQNADGSFCWPAPCLTILFDQLLEQALAKAVPEAGEITCRIWRGYYRMTLCGTADATRAMCRGMKKVLTEENFCEKALSAASLCRLLDRLADRRKEEIVQKGNLLAVLQVEAAFGPEAALENACYGLQGSADRTALRGGNREELLQQAVQEMAACLKAADEITLEYFGSAQGQKDFEETVRLCEAEGKRWGSATDKAAEALREAGGTAAFSFSPKRENTGYCIDSMVSFNAAGGRKKDMTPEERGILYACLHLLNETYLNRMIRQKGGAYHTKVCLERDGRLAMCSFRDSRVEGTLEDFAGAPDYLRELHMTEADLKEQLVGCIGALDKPRPPFVLAEEELEAWYDGETLEQRKRFRDAVFALSPEDLKHGGALLEEILAGGSRASVGNSREIRRCRFFDRIRSIE